MVCLIAIPVVTGLVLALLQVFRTYGTRPLTEELTSAVRASRIVLSTAAVLGAAVLTTRFHWMTGLGLLAFTGISWVGIVLNRTIYWERWQRSCEKKLAVCGMNGDAISVADRLHEGDTRTIVGVLTYDSDVHDSRWPRLGSSDELVNLYRSGHFDEIVFSIPKSSSVAVPLSLEASRNQIPHTFYVQGDRGSLTSDMDMPNPQVLSPLGPVGRAMKRVLDIVLSLIALTVAMPIFTLLSIAIPMDSKGGMFFRQKRIGENGRPFTILKFRTMHKSASAYAECPAKPGDSRVTRLGRILRATSIDELPQFLNVLAGTMSIVGPRPEMPFIVNEYNDLERMRLNAKPGITGVWQLSNCRNRPIHENVHFDLYYIQHQSTTLDLILMLQTVFMAYKGV